MGFSKNFTEICNYIENVILEVFPEAVFSLDVPNFEDKTTEYFLCDLSGLKIENETVTHDNATFGISLSGRILREGLRDPRRKSKVMEALVTKLHRDIHVNNSANYLQVTAIDIGEFDTSSAFVQLEMSIEVSSSFERDGEVL